MGDVVRIPIAAKKKQFFCRHLWAKDLFNACDDYTKKTKGVQLYKICARCGKVRKYKYIDRQTLNFVYWMNVRAFYKTRDIIFIDPNQVKIFKE